MDPDVSKVLAIFGIYIVFTAYVGILLVGTNSRLCAEVQSMTDDVQSLTEERDDAIKLHADVCVSRDYYVEKKDAEVKKLKGLNDALTDDLSAAVRQRNEYQQVHAKQAKEIAELKRQLQGVVEELQYRANENLLRLDRIAELEKELSLAKQAQNNSPGGRAKFIPTDQLTLPPLSDDQKAELRQLRESVRDEITDQLPVEPNQERPQKVQPYTPQDVTLL